MILALLGNRTAKPGLCLFSTEGYSGEIGNDNEAWQREMQAAWGVQQEVTYERRSPVVWNSNWALTILMEWASALGSCPACEKVGGGGVGGRVRARRASCSVWLEGVWVERDDKKLEGYADHSGPGKAFWLPCKQWKHLWRVLSRKKHTQLCVEIILAI